MSIIAVIKQNVAIAAETKKPPEKCVKNTAIAKFAKLESQAKIKPIRLFFIIKIAPNELQIAAQSSITPKDSGSPVGKSLPAAPSIDSKFVCRIKILTAIINSKTDVDKAAISAHLLSHFIPCTLFLNAFSCKND